MLALTALVAGVGGKEGQAARWLDQWRYRPQPVPEAADRQVGIIIGHQGFDSGALCPDGLTEAETVEAIGRLAAARLQRSGAQVDLLAEYDERLQGYQADVLVSIHADSCIERSGFKVARAIDSAIPAQEDRLVACLYDTYATATGLTFDWASITEDMTQYHAFKRISPSTPGAIIETGFLGGDRSLLVGRPEVAARGIADGILCYLTGNAPGEGG